MKIWYYCLFIIILSVSLIFSDNVVVTQIGAIESILQELTSNCDIEVINPIPSNITISEYQDYWDSNKKLIDSLAVKTDVVFGIWSFLPEDNLYTLLRSKNIRIVGIDCASPMLNNIRGIGKSFDAKGNINYYVWLSTSNVMKMSEIISKALILLYPQKKDKILKNTSLFKEKLFKLKANYTAKLSEVVNLGIITFGNDFDYFLKDMECFISANYSYDDVSENDSLAKVFIQTLKNSGSKVIVNKWAPLGIDIIDNYCSKNDIKIAVLKNGNPKSAGLKTGIYDLLKNNMETLYNAFTKKNNN